MKENTKMQRRTFLRTVALGGVATAATLTSMSPSKVFSITFEGGPFSWSKSHVQLGHGNLKIHIHISSN